MEGASNAHLAAAQRAWRHVVEARLHLEALASLLVPSVLSADPRAAQAAEHVGAISRALDGVRDALCDEAEYLSQAAAGIRLAAEGHRDG